MERPDWLDWSYEDAMKMVAERAVYSRSVGGLVKAGLFGLPTDRQQQEAVRQAQGGRAELGTLGADEGVVNEAVKGLRSGALSLGQAAGHMGGAVPGPLTQLQQVPQSFGTALEQGRLGSALAQLDVGGIKNVLPGTRHFSPLTAGLSGLANVGARGMLTNFIPGLRDVNLYRRLGELAEHTGHGRSASHVLTGTNLRERIGRFQGLGAGEKALMRNVLRQRDIEAAGKMKGLARLTGGLGPTLAALAPAAIHEWLLPGGYRSGHKPIMDIIEANKVLNASRAQSPR
jgi:hypothetical protein